MWFCQLLKAGRHAKVKKRLKKCFGQLLGARSTQKLVEIHNTGGSEISTSLDIKWSKRGCFANGLVLEWDLKSRSQTVLNPDKWLPFWEKPFETLTKITGF